MKCPECVKTNKKSIVTLGMMFTNAGPYYPVQYDEEGEVMPRPTPTTTTSYTCSNGHSWTKKS